MSSHIHIRFYQQLNDFLPVARRDIQFAYEFKKPRSIKDLIEAIGVPHTEIDIIMVDNQSVDFAYLITGNEQIEVYPVTYELNKPGLKHNQPAPLPEMKFVLDVHLGRLTAYMRMLGFDTLYRNDYDDPILAEISHTQQRILVTCDRRLLMRNQISYGYFMRSRKPKQQIVELLNRFDLFDYQPQAARCLACNGIIHRVAKKDIESQLLPLTKRHYDSFYQCNNCQKIYWEGSHHSKMQTLIERIKAQQTSID